MTKVIDANVFLRFAENAEAALEVLISEIPIASPKRQGLEESLKYMRKSIAELRETLQEPSPPLNPV
jgi:hypothetical protein